MNLRYFSVRKAGVLLSLAALAVSVDFKLASKVAAAPFSPPGAGGATSDDSPSFGGFTVLGETPTGKTLFIKLAAAQTLEAAITQTADELGTVFDGKPALSGAFADSQSRTRGGATLTAKFKGQDVHGVIFCGLGKKGAAENTTANVVFASTQASQADMQTLFAFLPPQMHEHVFPDGSGSIELPDGWTTKQQSATFGVVVMGPAGQTVAIGNSILVNTPDGNMVQMGQRTYQIQLQTYAMQYRSYEQNVQARRRFPNILALREPQKPVPPDPERDMPNLIFCRVCSGPDEVLKYFYPVMEKRARRAGGAYSTLDKIITVIPGEPNPLIPGSKSGVAYLVVSDHNGEKETPMRVINRISTYPVLDGANLWTVTFDVMRAPDATFDRDLPVMSDIMSSLKLNMDVVNKQIADAGAEVRRRGDEAQRQLLSGQEFNQQQDDHFRRFEAQMAAQQKARHDSASDFIEYIGGVRRVYDTKTGQSFNVNLFNSNAIVNGLNEGANSPNQYIQIPLRYDR